MIKKNFNVSNALLNSYGTFFYFFCQWLITILVVRLSGYEDAGVLSFVISTTNIFYCFTLYGVRNYQVSDINNNYSDTDYLGIRFITSIGTICLFTLFLKFMNFDDNTLKCLIVYIFYKFGEAFSDLLFGFDQKYLKYKEIAISYTLKGIVTLSTFCIALYLTQSLFFALLVNVVFYFMILLFYDCKNLKNNLSINFKKFNGLLLLKICFPLMLYICMVPYLNFITRFVVKNSFGVSELGYYSSITMVFSVLSTLMNSIYVTILPKISTMFYNGQFYEIKRIVMKMLLFLFMLSVIGVVIGHVLGDFVFELVFGPEILSYMYLLPMTIISSIILTAISFMNSILIAFRQNRIVLIGNVLSCGILTIFVFGLVEKFGMIGSLYSIALALLVNGIISFITIMKAISN